MPIAYLPFSSLDLAGVARAVERYAAAGLNPEYTDLKKEEGVVTIRFDDPMRAVWVYFEIHKVAKRRWVNTKANWIIQLYSQCGDEPEIRGCVFAPTQAHAISAAEFDVRNNFMSVCTFELAAA